MSELLVLQSCLNANVDEIILNSNIKSDQVLVNQCDREREYIKTFEDHQVYVIETTTRGLSKSRNLALEKAAELPHEILMITDDDVVFLDGYEKTIVDTYNYIPEADFIAFKYYAIGTEDKNIDYRTYPTDSDLGRVHKVRRTQKYFSSVQITFKKSFVLDHNIKFDERFGAGSDIYSHGEDSIFVRDIRSNKAKIYESQAKLLAVDFSNSTWRNITDEKFFNDKGAVWKILSPRLYWFYGLLLISKISKDMNTRFFKSYSQYLKGARMY